jgi:hypothetical protein
MGVAIHGLLGRLVYLRIGPQFPTPLLPLSIVTSDIHTHRALVFPPHQCMFIGVSHTGSSRRSWQRPLPAIGHRYFDKTETVIGQPSVACHKSLSVWATPIGRLIEIHTQPLVGCTTARSQYTQNHQDTSHCFWSPTFLLFTHSHTLRPTFKLSALLGEREQGRISGFFSHRLSRLGLGNGLRKLKSQLLRH